MDDSGELAPALKAIRHADAAKLAQLLHDSPDLSLARTRSGASLLGVAAFVMTAGHALPAKDGPAGAADVVRLLLAGGADPSFGDADGWTPLHSAGMVGQIELARILLDAGADVAAGAFAIPSATPLAFCLFYGHVEAAQVLAGTAAGPRPDDLRTAAALGDIEALNRLLRAPGPLVETAAEGFDFAGPPAWFPPRALALDDQGVLDEALTWASRAAQVVAMARLVDAGANVNSNPYRGTPLLWSIYHDAVEAATWLIDHGADPNLRHDFGGSEHGRGATAMHLAAQYGALRCLQLLLDRGADPSLRDTAYDGTPLGWALHEQQAEAVAILEAYSTP